MAEPEWFEYPSLLDLPRPRFRAYRPETAIAEKVHAMVVLGAKNSRMRDFFDVHALAMRKSFDGNTLSRPLRATSKRRRTESRPSCRSRSRRTSRTWRASGHSGPVSCAGSARLPRPRTWDV